MARQSCAILFIGPVNTKTGKINGKDPMFDTIWECWAEDANQTNMLVGFGGESVAIVHTAGKGDEVGSTYEYHHDQSGRRIGLGTVLRREPHTREGLKNLGAWIGKTSIRTATMK